MATRVGPRWRRASVRLRTTAAAVLVVAIVLALGAAILVALVADTLRDGVETAAEQRAAALVEQIESSGLPATGAGDDGDLDDRDLDDRDLDDRDLDDDEDGRDDEPDDVVWQVLTDGVVVSTSADGIPALADAARDRDGEEIRLPGAEHRYLVVSEEAARPDGDGDYVVVVAVSLEDVEESTAALLTPLLVGLPILLVLLGATTWMVVTRALAPVERIRREVDQITGDRLDRRVPEPAAEDEIHRLAQTMNRMLARLEDSRDRQRQFVGDASHELRSPLASIRQSAEVARSHPAALPEGELAEAVLEESVRMQRIVEQLLLLTRTDQGAVGQVQHDVDLDDLVLAEAKRLRRTGGDDLTVDTSRVGPGRVRGDAVALGQVVRNLVDNAVRHAEATISLSVHEDDDGVHLIVADDGIGIPEADRERVFERFVRLDEARSRDAGGSGLGLAIVREIVAAHGGRVRAGTSALGGAQFAVQLPSAG